MDLHGRKALVTGAAGGIGRAIVNRLLSGGAEVVAADREIDDSSEGNIRNTLDYRRSFGPDLRRPTTH